MYHIYIGYIFIKQLYKNKFLSVWENSTVVLKCLTRSVRIVTDAIPFVKREINWSKGDDRNRGPLKMFYILHRGRQTSNTLFFLSPSISEMWNSSKRFLFSRLVCSSNYFHAWITHVKHQATTFRFVCVYVWTFYYMFASKGVAFIKTVLWSCSERVLTFKKSWKVFLFLRDQRQIYNRVVISLYGFHLLLHCTADLYSTTWTQVYTSYSNIYDSSISIACATWFVKMKYSKHQRLFSFIFLLRWM